MFQSKIIKDKLLFLETLFSFSFIRLTKMPMDLQFVSEPTVGMLACAEYVFELLGIRSQGSIKQS